MSAAYRYQPYYCEENIWWLCQQPQLAGGRRLAVFIANGFGHCALWQQRVASPGQPVLWDYHVVLFRREPHTARAVQPTTPLAGWRVWDLDSRLALALPLDRYLAETFRPLPAEQQQLAPRFRLVGADELLATFSTDRSHMRDGRGGWLHPPPGWPPPTAPAEPANLSRFIDPLDDVAGQMCDLSGLERLLARLG